MSKHKKIRLPKKHKGKTLHSVVVTTTEIYDFLPDIDPDRLTQTVKNISSQEYYE